VQGGLAGGRADQWRIRSDGGREHLDACAQVSLSPGERLLSISTGGGGYGSPLERDPHEVAHDVAERWISAQRALEIYGVVVGDDGTLDVASTQAVRASARSGRVQ
jgi:N-methylhydantoinase B